MNQKTSEKWKCSFTDILPAAAGAVFLVGMYSWFSVCKGAEGMTMSCHWAGEALKSAAVLFLVLAAVHLAVKSRPVKAGMDLCLAGLGIYILLLPGRIISLCMMPDMACRSHTQPAAVLFGLIFTAASLADLFVILAGEKDRKHHRQH